MATIAKKQFHKNEIKEKLATDNRWLERGYSSNIQIPNRC